MPTTTDARRRRPSDQAKADRNVAMWRDWRAAADAHGPRSADARDAMRDLVEANLGLIWRIALWYANARRFRGDDARIDDCVSEGVLGFMRGVEGFDPENAAGASLAHYARHWVNQRIRRWLWGDSLIHVPVYLADGRATGSTVVANRRAALASRRVVEFSQIDSGFGASAEAGMVAADGGACLVESAEETEQRRATIAGLMSCLTAKEREILTLRYGLGGRAPMTQREINELFGKSRGFAWKVELEALRKMRRKAERGNHP